jgi:uncharacterized protein
MFSTINLRLFRLAAQTSIHERSISLPAIALSLAIVLASLIASSAFLRAKRLDQTIKITGSAKRRLKSDLMIWRTSVSVESATLADAYSRLTCDVEKTKASLVAQGFPGNQIVVSTVTTTPIRSSPRGPQGLQVSPEGAGPVSFNGRITSYTLTQSLELRSSEIDKLTAVSRKVTQLINQGILLESNEPEYLYTQLAELEVPMLADAAPMSTSAPLRLHRRRWQSGRKALR